MTAAGAPSDTPSPHSGRAASRYARAGLELVGLEADEAELAVIEAADALYRPLIESLAWAELDGIEPEPGEDMSRPPHSLDRR